MPHLQPELGALQLLSQLPDHEPVVMLNMLRFREHAEYPNGGEHKPCSGRDAYRRYGALVLRHVQAVGAHVVWMGEAQATVIGPSTDSWDEVLLVQYPSRQAFLKMVSEPDYLASAVHRTAALADSRLIAMRAVSRIPTPVTG